MTGRWGLAVLAAVAAVGTLAGCDMNALPIHSARPSASANTAAPPPVTVTGGDPWPGYHSDNSRTGSVAAQGNLDHLAKAWTARLAGGVYGQPVVADGRIIVADESNHVTALDPSTGNTLWTAYLGSPLTNVDSAAGCGDIDPLGITSTPVIDTKTNVVYVVGEVRNSATSVHHQLEGIDIATGKVVLSTNADPPLRSGQTAIHLLQRASLALANGRVYVPYGGNAGDCGNYHGWVVGINETGAANKISFEVASDGEGGAIWGGGAAPAIDQSGDLYVTTGNANPDPPAGGPDPKKYTESVVRLTPDLVPLASFKDRIAGGDEDLSTGSPVLLPQDLLFAVGKTDVGYILRRSDLSQVATVRGICGSDPDGGPAYYAALRELFVPCRGGGIQVVRLGSLVSSTGGTSTPPRLGPRLTGPNSAPIVVGGKVWALAYTQGTLYEFDALTYARIQSRSIGASVEHFASPTAADGLLLIGTSTGIVAFKPAS